MQVDAKKLAGGGQVTRIFLNCADQGAGGVLKICQFGAGLTVASASQGICHGAEVFFSLVHHTGNAVLLEGVDAFHAFGFQRINTESGQMQRPGADAKQQRRQDVGGVLMRHHGQRAAQTHADGCQNFAWQSGAAGDLAFVKGGLSDQPLAQQPCGQRPHPRTGKAEGHRNCPIAQRGGDQRNRGDEHDVAAPACRADLHAPLLFRGGAAVTIRAVFAAIPLRHG